MQWLSFYLQVCLQYESGGDNLLLQGKKKSNQAWHRVMLIDEGIQILSLSVNTVDVMAPSWILCFLPSAVAISGCKILKAETASPKISTVLYGAVLQSVWIQIGFQMEYTGNLPPKKQNSFQYHVVISALGWICECRLLTTDVYV